jgi:hypothetical protein
LWTDFLKFNRSCLLSESPSKRKISRKRKQKQFTT